MKPVGIILTYNEAFHIVDCIQSLKHISDHIIVLDSHSTDQTVELARQAGAEVAQRSFDNYAGQRNAALELARSRAKWVLFVDADERVSPELADEIQSLPVEDDHAGYRIPRFNYIFGHRMRGAGWYPDHQTRLLRIDSAHYDPAREVHELVLLDGPEGTLTEHFIHYNYSTLAQFVAKQHRYTAYDAQIMFQQRVQPRLHNYVLQPLRQFWWRFVTLNGYRDGLYGLLLSALMAWYEFRKYWLLNRLHHKEKGAL